MAERPAHLATRYRDRLTPRQEEILSMIAKGRTNFDIAQAFGISLDGAKWHVREILSKLNVDSREDAAEEWRRQRSVGARLSNALRAIVPSRFILPLAAGAATVGVAGAVVVGGLMLWGGSDDEPPAGTPPVETTTATPDTGDDALNEPLPTDGSGEYAYEPELAYVDPDGVAWLVNADGTDRRQILDGCTGIGSPKSGELTGGLRWSPSGDWIACWREDLSVRAAAVEGSVSGEPFGPGECQGPVSGPAFPPGAPGVACETADGLEVRDVATGDVVRTYPTTLMGAHRWLPDGGVIMAGSDVNSRMTWLVFDADGEQVAHIKDAYVGEARAFAVTSDGKKIAYPGDQGLTVLDLESGDVRRLNLNFFNEGGSGSLSWALAGDGLLVKFLELGGLFEVASGELLHEQVRMPLAGRVSPDGRYLVGIAEQDSDGNATVGIADLKAGHVAIVVGSELQLTGLGLGPHFTWSGGSSRFCWTVAANNPDAAKYCADVDDPVAEEIVPPLQFPADELGYGNLDITWHALSPDLSKVAYTFPGPDGGSPAITEVQVLRTAGIDGSDELTLGPPLALYPAAWRPDGVVRP